MPAELPCSIVLAGSDRNGRRFRGLSGWSCNVRKWSWWRSDVDAWLFRKMILFWTAQKNDSVLNRSGEWLQKQYQKHQLVRFKFKVKTDRTNQPIEPIINQSIKPPTDRSRARLPARHDKQLLSEAKDNQERLCKRANGQDNLHKQTTKKHQLNKRPRSSNSSESNWIATKRATHPRAVGSQSADWTINQMVGQTWAQVQAPPLRSELVRSLDQGLEVWNRPGAKSQPQRPWRFKRFKSLMYEHKE